MPVKAVVLAAGAGTRMKSSLPKVVHEIAGRPLVGWVLHALDEVGVKGTSVVVAPAAEAVTSVLPDSVIPAVQDEQLGTAHATRVGLEALELDAGDQVIVLPGDTPLLVGATLQALVEQHESEGNVATCLTARLEDPTGYGRVVRGEDGAVTGVVEHKDASDDELRINEINGGIYIFDSQALSEALDRVRADNAQGEYYLPDVLAIFVESGQRVGALVASEAELAGVNSQDQLAEAATVLRHRINGALMRDGVWMRDPGRVYIDAGVTVEPGAKLHPDVYLEGNTSIAAGAEIGPDVYLRDTDVGQDATIWYAVIREASIGPEAEVGPYVSLRPGAQLLTGSKAGTFVEMKNSTIREGAKVPHLSYVGDADVGEKANIGAGTITVNYDGFTKSRTIVGKGARIGSNTMLVAPVEIGDGAFTGAGSVITKDVSEGALGIERSQQKEIPGYAARKSAQSETKKAD